MLANDASWDSAFPLAGQGRLLQPRSISGPYSRSLLFRPTISLSTYASQWPVTGHHARLGTRLLARLCRGCHLRQLSSTRLQGATRIEPYVRLARIRLPPRTAGLAAFRTRSGTCDTLSRHCVRHVWHRFAFSLASLVAPKRRSIEPPDGRLAGAKLPLSRNYTTATVGKGHQIRRVA